MSSCSSGGQVLSKQFLVKIDSQVSVVSEVSGFLSFADGDHSEDFRVKTLAIGRDLGRVIPFNVSSQFHESVSVVKHGVINLGVVYISKSD